MSQDPIDRYTNQLKSSWEPQKRHPSRFKNVIINRIADRRRTLRRNILTGVAIIAITTPFAALHLNEGFTSSPYAATLLASSHEGDYDWWGIGIGEPQVTEGLSQDYVILASLFLEEADPIMEETVP